MIVQVTDGSFLFFNQQVPPEYQQHLLQGSVSSFSANDWGNVLVQEFKAKRFSIRLWIIDMAIRMPLRFLNSELRACLTFNSANVISIKPGREKTLRLTAEQYAFYVGDEEITIDFEGKNNYKIFETVYYDSLLLDIKESVIEQQSQNIPISYCKQSSLYFNDIVREILQNFNRTNYKLIYFENKVRELLLEVLQDTSKLDTTSDLPLSHINSLIEAKRIILSDLSSHKTIAELSKEVQLNEFDLKNGFKKLWGMGIFEMLSVARMDRAKKLVIGTQRPMKEIAVLSGYEHLTSFIRAFKNYHGVPPGELRR